MISASTSTTASSTKPNCIVAETIQNKGSRALEEWRPLPEFGTDMESR